MGHISLLWTRTAPSNSRQVQRNKSDSFFKESNVWVNVRIATPGTDGPSVFIQELKSVIRPTRCGWSCAARCKEYDTESVFYSSHSTDWCAEMDTFYSVFEVLSEVNGPEL